MRYKKEHLQLNVEQFVLEDVIDFEATQDKWEFLKFDPFNWNNQLEAQKKDLVTEEDSVVYYEHSSSIERDISNVAKIFSISLNRCYKRKTLLEELNFNSLKYDSVLNSLHSVIEYYNTALKEVDAEISSNNTKGYEHDAHNLVLNYFRDSIDKSKQNYFHELEHYQISFTRMAEYLQNVKVETEKYHAMLQKSIELAEVYLQTEVEIKSKAQERMHAMRKDYLQSVTHYNRFGSTVPEGYEDERSATEDEQLGNEQKTTSEQSEPAEAASEPVSSI